MNAFYSRSIRTEARSTAENTRRKDTLLLSAIYYPLSAIRYLLSKETAPQPLLPTTIEPEYRPA
jgi:hypothetical protein